MILSRHKRLTLLHATTGLKLLPRAVISLYLPLSALTCGDAIASTADQPLDWHTDQILRVMPASDGQEARVVTVDGKKCLEGVRFSFDVDDRYAFDIDETVQVEVEFYRHATAVVPEVNYERNGEAEAKVRGLIPAKSDAVRTHRESFSLERARFANRGAWHTDFSIGVGGTRDTAKQKITICDLSLKRSYATVMPKAFGSISLKVSDETGKRVPARVGIYDRTGRLPLPSEEAIAVNRRDDTVRVVNISPDLELIPWPVRNRSGFYVNGAYRAKLPVGEYELVVAKGPEYRFFHRKFTVEKDRTQSIEVKLKRWDDLPAKGWYSGDNHIHYVRHDRNDDRNLLLFMQAEDVHVANILHMKDTADAAWPQYGWASTISLTAPTYAFVPGQEDPRTRRRGHSISLNLREPIGDPRKYLLYHEVFEKARAQGGITGYAHGVGRTLANATGGLALDVPFGLVDFVEVMQFGYGGSNVWFDFLNLGYKMVPSAGTDYVSDFTLPGAERNYVYVPKPFSLQGWFDGLKRGHTFVSNGPTLEFTVNGHGMGSELHLKSGDKLVIDASASINSDIDSLDNLELIEQGEVVKTVKTEHAGETSLRLHRETAAQHGTWFVVRVRGKLPHKQTQSFYSFPEYATANQVSAKLALSGAIYIYVDGQSFWKPSAVPSIVQSLKEGMEKLMAPPGPGEEEELGTRELSLPWDSQIGLLKQRVDRVMPIYNDLVARANRAMKKR